MNLRVAPPTPRSSPDQTVLFNRNNNNNNNNNGARIANDGCRATRRVKLRATGGGRTGGWVGGRSDFDFGGLSRGWKDIPRGRCGARRHNRRQGSIPISQRGAISTFSSVSRNQKRGNRVLKDFSSAAVRITKYFAGGGGGGEGVVGGGRRSNGSGQLQICQNVVRNNIGWEYCVSTMK